MHDKKYTLTWPTYSDHLRDMMRELKMNEHFTDVTLVTKDNKCIKAHKNILSACSPVFRDKLRNLGEKCNSIIHLRSICSSRIEKF